MTKYNMMREDQRRDTWRRTASEECKLSAALRCREREDVVNCTFWYHGYCEAL